MSKTSHDQKINQLATHNRHLHSVTYLPSSAVTPRTQQSKNDHPHRGITIHEAPFDDEETEPTDYGPHPVWCNRTHTAGGAHYGTFATLNMSDEEFLGTVATVQLSNDFYGATAVEFSDGPITLAYRFSMPEAEVVYEALGRAIRAACPDVPQPLQFPTVAEVIAQVELDGYEPLALAAGGAR